MAYESELKLGVEATRLAAEHLFKLHESRHKIVDDDAGKDIKLRADKESEAIILKTLETSGIPVLAEESGEHGLQDGMRWIVDPIDGTLNFFRGMLDLCGISVALWDGDRPVLGVVNRLFSNEIYTGIVGGTGAARCNGDAISPSSVRELGQAIYATGIPSTFRLTPEKFQEQFGMFPHVKKVRMFGAASLMGTFVAAGKCDIYRENGIMFWDVAAAIAIVAAAGACYTCRIGKEYRTVTSCYANEALKEAFENHPSLNGIPAV